MVLFVFSHAMLYKNKPRFKNNIWYCEWSKCTNITVSTECARPVKWVWPKNWVKHTKMIEGMRTHHTQDLPTIQVHTLHLLVYLKLQNPKDQLHTLYGSQPNMESILQSVLRFHLSHDKHAFNCQLPMPWIQRKQWFWKLQARIVDDFSSLLISYVY